MKYFKDAKVGDNVLGLVFDEGVITRMLNGHYHFLVTFKNGHEIPYTIDGIPGWGMFDEQTLFYDSDKMGGYNEKLGHVTELEDSIVDGKACDIKQIVKWRKKKILEVCCPSGLWTFYKKCPKKYVEDLLENQKFHMFRKKASCK